jgi:hypothetical protein
VSTASNAKPATEEDLEETARQVRLGRQCTAIKADSRDMESGRSDRARAWKDRHRGGGRSHSTLEAASGDGQRSLARCHRQQSQRRREHDPRLHAQDGGTQLRRIIVLSSMQGKHGTKDASSYCASKWGILGLMKSAAMELGQLELL